jgi:uncharacterized protein involved in outer membrane biogenesis
MRLIGRLLIGLVVLVVVAVGGAYLYLSSYDKTELARLIEQEAEAALGREVTIAGPLEFDLNFTTPGITIADVTISNAKWGSRKEMAKVGEFGASVAFMPLLTGNIEISRVRLKGADLLLETNSDGEGNWEFGDPQAAGSRGAGVPMQATVILEEVKLTYRDGKTKDETHISLAALTADPQGEEVKLTVGGDVNGDAVSFEGLVAQSQDKLAVRDAVFTMGQGTVRGSASFSPGAESGRPRIDAELAGDTFDLSPFTKGDGKSGGAMFSNSELGLTEIKGIDGRLVLSASKLIIGRIVLENAKATAVLEKDAMIVNPLSATYKGAPVIGELAVNAAEGAPRVGIKLDTTGFDLGSLLKETGVSDKLATKITLVADVTGRGNSMKAIASSLGGQTNIVLGRGTIATGFAELIAKDLVRSLVMDRSSGQTTLVCGVSRFDFAGGVGKTRALVVETEATTTTGSGSINLGKETLNLTISPRPKDASLISLATDLHVTGPIRSPSVVPDAASVAKGVAGALGGVALTGGVGALLPLVSTGSSGDAGGCVQRAKERQEDAGVLEKTGDTVEDAVEGITEGIGNIFD